MENNKQHIKPDFENFKRYQADEMSGTERHRFEKSLLENPFLAEAYEGYLMMLSSADLNQDRISSELKQALESRIQPERRRIFPLWTRAAAGIVVALSAGWALFRDDLPRNDSENLQKKPHDSQITTKKSQRIEATGADQSKKNSASEFISPKRTVKEIVPQSQEDSQEVIAFSATSPDGISIDRTDQDRTTKDSSTAIGRSLEIAATDRLASAKPLPSVATPPDASPDAAANERLSTAAALNKTTQSKGFYIRGTSPLAKDSLSVWRPISGRVIDEKGNALASVAVIHELYNGKQSTLTDTSGAFSVWAQSGKTLVLSMPGYKTRQLVITKPVLGNISMEINDTSLSEVVVVGYGIQKKAAHVGSLNKSATLPTRDAIPSKGWSHYQSYLAENTRQQNKGGTVVVKFTVNRSGKLKNIEASGPDHLKKTAINIVRSGPKWLPANKDGKPLTSKSEVMLIFKN